MECIHKSTEPLPCEFQASILAYEVSEGDGYSEALVFPMDFPRTYERMAIWSAMPTSLLGAGLGAGSGSSFLGSILLGAGSMSALRNSSHWNLGALIGCSGICSSIWHCLCRSKYAGSDWGIKGLVALLVMLRSWSIMASSSCMPPIIIMSSVICGCIIIGAGGGANPPCMPSIAQDCWKRRLRIFIWLSW